MTDFEKLSKIIENGQVDQVRGLIQQLLSQSVPTDRIVREGFMPGLREVGRKFESHEIFLPEMMVAARTVKLGSETMRSWMGYQKPSGQKKKIALGVVQGDLHDIGKNLVAMTMSSIGIPVIDLGVDVSPEQFVRAVEADESITLVGISALLSATMAAMKKTVEALCASPARSRITILVGGAPITEEFARSIGADIFTESAFDAADAVRVMLEATGLKGD